MMNMRPKYWQLGATFILLIAVGLLALGAFQIAIGIFTSSLTPNILPAFFASFALNVFFVFGMVGISWLSRSELVREWAGALIIPVHLDEFARGIIDVRYLVFYITGTAFFLFLAVRSLESRKWR